MSFEIQFLFGLWLWAKTEFSIQLGLWPLGLVGCSTTVSWCEGVPVALKMKVGAVRQSILARDSRHDSNDIQDDMTHRHAHRKFRRRRTDCQCNWRRKSLICNTTREKSRI